MHSLYRRKLEQKLQQDLNYYPAVAILGPRQSGKSTLAKMLLDNISESLYLDLERTSDLKKIEDPELFFENQKKKLVCLDEIQRSPELFPVLRSILDQNNKNGQVLVLGSASRELIRQSSESLAGRICYRELTPFLLSEVSDNNHSMNELWLKGGFPRSLLIPENRSLEWRNEFIRNYIERDIPQSGFNIPALTLRRLWMMCAHLHAQFLNSSKLGESLGLSHTTVRSYIEMFEHAFILRLLYPYESNLRKRIVKSPKMYIRDSGLLHAMLNIESFDDLLGHPVFGPSWEGFVIENILTEFPDWSGYFYRASSGAEIDLILEKGTRKIAVECKASSAPELNRGFWNAMNDLGINEAWVIAPVKELYQYRKNVIVAPPDAFINMLSNSS